MLALEKRKPNPYVNARSATIEGSPCCAIDFDAALVAGNTEELLRAAGLVIDCDRLHQRTPMPSPI